MRVWLRSAIMVCLMAAAIATVTYRIGVADGQDSVLGVMCERVDSTWNREALVCE